MPFKCGVVPNELHPRDLREHALGCIPREMREREEKGQWGRGAGEGRRMRCPKGVGEQPEDSLQCSFTYRPVGATGMLLDHKSTSG